MSRTETENTGCEEEKPGLMLWEEEEDQVVQDGDGEYRLREEKQGLMLWEEEEGAEEEDQVIQGGGREGGGRGSGCPGRRQNTGYERKNEG